MSDCPQDSDNGKASIYVIGSASFVALWYIVDIIASVYSRRKIGNACTALSSLLATAIGITFFKAKWPQPIEAAGFMVVVLGQASAWGWYRYMDPQEPGDDMVIKALFEKIPDFLAVLGTAFYALVFTVEEYQEKTANGWVIGRDPKTQGWMGVAIAASALLLGPLALLLRKELRRYPMIAYTFVLGVFTFVIGCFQISISRTNCGNYQVGGYLAAFDLLLGACISFAHCYYWYGKVFFQRVPRPSKPATSAGP